MAKRTHDAPEELCPCNRGRPYAACCGPLHAGAPAAGADPLMRSRYAAFSLGDAVETRVSTLVTDPWTFRV